MRMTLKNVRLAFPAIFEPQAFGEAEPAYSAKFIIPPDHPQVADIRKAVETVAREKWQDKAPGILKLLKDDKKVAWVEGPYYNKKTGELHNGFDGMFHVSARSAQTKPSVFDAANNPVTDRGMIYGGCFVDASIEFYAQDNKWGRRINCGLRGVRFAGHGDAFGGGAPATADDFGEPSVADDFC